MSKMLVRKDIKNFIRTIPSGVTLVAATKYVDSQEMKKLLASGINNFGENRVDSFLTKHQELKDEDVIWHFIGHLQRNKAKEVINKIDYLHSLDSLKLAELINKEREEVLPCFIEVSVNNEVNKNGVRLEELDHFVEQLKDYPKIKVVGLMMMAVRSANEEELEKQFEKLALLKEELNHKYNLDLQYLSMGMSDDYLIAIKKGATHVRLGRILFTD